MPTCQTLISASCIVTQDEQRRVLHDASIAIDKGLIIELGARMQMKKKWQAEQDLDLPKMLILPGLINAHTHVAMTFLRGLADDLPLLEWLEQRIFPIESKLNPEIVRIGSLAGFAEMLRTGTTACQDMYLFEPAVMEAAKIAGIRCLGGEGVFAFASASCHNATEALSITREMAVHTANEERLNVVVAPHTVYTTTPKILEDCRDLAEELHLPLHLHLAESPSETELCLQKYGQRPVAYCANLGLFDLPCSIAHAVDLTQQEIELLSAKGVVAVHNVSSNMKLASGVANVPAMLRAGLTVALGTDGAASNNRLNMFTEIGRTALLHKVTNAEPTLLPAGKVLDLATRNGAKAFWDNRLGSLAPGQVADCVALDLQEPNLQPIYNEISHLVYAATGMETRLTMVAGQVVYANGKFTGFNLEDLYKELADLRKFVC